ncbi:MAG: hypothetical protein ACXWID_08615 [Pyrinomonadaceae bacterium]
MPATQNPSDTSQLSLSSTDDGFNGAFSFEGRRYAIENRVGKGYFRTIIAHPDGRSIVAGAQKDGVVFIQLPSGNIVVDTTRPRQFSETEIKALEDFVDSGEAALVRRIVYEVRNAQIAKKQPFLKGFRIIAMFLGDGDVKISATEKGIDRSKLMFKMANYSCDRPLSSVNFKKPSCDENNCCGCCGPGCWGCSGCWTPACLAHDQCVDSQGYLSPTCMQLLQAAIESMVLLCDGVS